MSWSACNCCEKVSRDADNGYPEDWHLVTLVGEAGEESIRLYLMLCPVCIERLPGGFKTWIQFQAYFDTRNQGSDNWLLNRKESLEAVEESPEAVEESPEAVEGHRGKSGGRRGKSGGRRGKFVG